MKIIVVFENRTQSLVFSRDLKKIGVPCSLINTPREIVISCGVSVQLDEKYIAKALALLKTRKYLTFKGIYRVNTNSFGYKYSKI